MIYNFHIAVVVNPQLAYDNVMNSGSDLFVREFRVRIIEVYVCISNRGNREIFSTESRCHRKILEHHPSPTLRVVCCSRRMVGHLENVNN